MKKLRLIDKNIGRSSLINKVRLQINYSVSHFFDFLDKGTIGQNRKIRRFLNKEICVIRGRPVGFFSLFFEVLEHINVCKELHIKPVIFFGKECLYWDTKLGKHSNLWEYFFEPISDLKSADYENSIDTKSVIVSKEYFNNLIPENIVNEKKRLYISEIIRENVKIKKEIIEEVESFIDKYFKNKIIGVHLRGRERYNDLHFEFYGYLEPSYYFKEIEKKIKMWPGASIYVASDNEPMLNEFRKKYGDKVITGNFIRSKDEYGKIHFNNLTTSYSLAKQVLLDSLILSKCDFLIHGISNVAHASCYFNNKLDHVDIYKKYRFESLLKW